MIDILRWVIYEMGALFQFGINNKYFKDIINKNHLSILLYIYIYFILKILAWMRL